jgi:hypothetical protein
MRTRRRRGGECAAAAGLSAPGERVDAAESRRWAPWPTRSSALRIASTLVHSKRIASGTRASPATSAIVSLDPDAQRHARKSRDATTSTEAGARAGIARTLPACPDAGRSPASYTAAAMADLLARSVLKAPAAVARAAARRMPDGG